MKDMLHIPLGGIEVSRNDKAKFARKQPPSLSDQLITLLVQSLSQPSSVPPVENNDHTSPEGDKATSCRYCDGRS